MRWWTVVHVTRVDEQLGQLAPRLLNFLPARFGVALARREAHVNLPDRESELSDVHAPGVAVAVDAPILIYAVCLSVTFALDQ